MIKDKKLPIWLIASGVLVLLMVAILLIMQNGRLTKKVLNISGDKIPTIYKVAGKKDILQYKTTKTSSAKKIKILYDIKEVSKEEVSKYITYLLEDGFEIKEEFTDYYKILTKLGKDNKSIIEVEVYYDVEKLFYIAYKK